MNDEPPADHIKNPGRKPGWEEDQMEAAIDCYFEIRNFNQAAREHDVPVSTLFYKVKIDPRYGEERKEPESDELAEQLKGLGKKLGEGAALGVGVQGGAYLAKRLFGPEGIKKLLYGSDKEKVEVASRFCASFILCLRELTGLTDPFARGVEPADILAALAYNLDLDSPERSLYRQLLNRVARDWKDPGPVESEMDLGKYRTVPPSRIPPDRKDRLDEFAKRKNVKTKAYLQNDKEQWAILTSSGKIHLYFPSGPGSFEEWGKAIEEDF